MNLIALGINHKTAPIEIRERVAFAPEQMPDTLRRLISELGLAEMALLSTCNRTELYCVAGAVVGAETQAEESQALLHWVGGFHQIPVEDLQQSSYTHYDAEAIKHLMRVASGLDSMVLGEPQILGQIKSAYAVAQTTGSLGGMLERLFQSAFAVAKQVRTETAIGRNPVSVAYAAVSLAQRIFSDMGKTQALLIGAGRTVDLVARHLRQAGVERMVVANRTAQRAQELADNFGARAVLLSDIPQELAEADIVIASTASQLPILGKGAVETALKKRKHRPIYMVDIAVPRDIEPEVGELSDVYLYSVDDLEQVVESNLKSRQDAADEAEHIVNNGVQALMREVSALDVVGTLTACRRKAESIRDLELERALKQLASGQEPRLVAEDLSHKLMNKLLHTPTVQMKKVSAEGRKEVLSWVQELFDLSPDDVNAEDKHGLTQERGKSSEKNDPS